MDPNQALKDLREGLQRVRAAQDKGRPIEDTAMLERVLSAAEALDEWLSRGGFLPEDWNKHNRTQ